MQPALFAGDLDDGSAEPIAAQPVFVKVNDLEAWLGSGWPQLRESYEKALEAQDAEAEAEQPLPEDEQPVT